MVTGLEEVLGLCPDPPQEAVELMRREWPGPLTLVLPSGPRAPSAVLGPDRTLAVRSPADPLSRDLLRLLEAPFVSTSANRTGEAPVLDPDLVSRTIASEADLFIDAGPLPEGGPSRILRITSAGVERLR